MPGGDRTGPAGMGPMTGRAAGYCAGYPMPGYRNPAFRPGFFPGYGYTPYQGNWFTGPPWGGGGFRFGRGRGFGFGRGPGFRRGFGYRGW
jgi:hypothetical protein